MEIVLYRTASDHRKLTKELTLVADKVSCNLKGNVSIERPSLIFTIPSSVSEFNYIYIASAPFFGRYYYVDDITLNANNLATVSCSIDVLMSHKAEILKEKAILDRQESKVNAYFSDSEIPLENRLITTFKEFPQGFSKTINYYLTIGG